MSDEQDSKFMKPGDDPVLDRALNELRFDSGLYQRGEYDLFGRRRAMGPEAEGAEEKPAAAPVSAPVAPPLPQRKRKIVAGVLAVLAALGPVFVYATVWKPAEVHATKMSASAAPAVTSAAPAVTSVAPAETSAAPAASVAPVAPRAEPAATGAPSVSVTAPVAPPSIPRATGKRTQPRGEEGHPDEVALPRPVVTAPPQVTAAPTAPPPPQSSADPLPGPVPMFKREQ